MVIIWLMMVNNNLVGGAITIMEFVNGKDDIPYIISKMFETTKQNKKWGLFSIKNSSSEFKLQRDDKKRFFTRKFGQHYLL